MTLIDQSYPWISSPRARLQTLILSALVRTIRLYVWIREGRRYRRFRRCPTNKSRQTKSRRRRRRRRHRRPHRHHPLKTPHPHLHPHHRC